MDKKQPIEFLKQKLNKINHLKSLPHGNSEQCSWVKDIEYVLEEVYGHDSSEYKRFFKTFSNVHVFGKEQEEYQKELEMREQALLFLINKVASGEKSKSVLKKVWRKPWNFIIVGIPVLAALIYVIDYFVKLFGK